MQLLMKIFLLVGVVMLGWQCQSNVVGRLDLDYAGDKLTLNGYFSTDTVFLVVGKSTEDFLKLDYRDLVAPNPVVYIEDESGKFKHRLVQRDSLLFTAGRIGLEPGKRYRIIASATDLTSVESNFIELPDSTNLLNLQILKYPGFEELVNEMRFAIRDRDQSDYYFFDMELKKSGIFGSAPSWTLDAQSLEFCYTTKIFSDLCFQGKRIQMSYYGRMTSYFRGFAGKQTADSIILRFGQVSREAYLQKLSRPVDEEFIEGINEPPLSYTNIKNGYGVVFAHSLRDYLMPVAR